MTFNDFLITFRQKFPPYLKTTEKKDIHNYTKSLLEDLIILLESVEEKEYSSIQASKRNVIENITNQKTKILLAIQSFRKGDMLDCYDLIFNTYFSSEIDKFKHIAYKPLDNHKPFFRLRINKSNRPFNHMEMFHIPYGKTHLVTNQRFSLSGYPCLYLGTSSYCCWEELNRPDLERCNFSVFRNERSLNLFDLSPPIKIKSEKDLFRYPLLVSCAIKITEDDASFKPEYIIPQTVLQSIIRFNNRKNNSVQLDGILYLSTKIGEKVFFEDENMLFNIVLPTTSADLEKQYCSHLMKTFTVSDVITYQEIWLKYPQLITALDEGIDFRDDPYSLSIFYKIEQFLTKGRKTGYHPIE